MGVFEAQDSLPDSQLREKLYSVDAIKNNEEEEGNTNLSEAFL